MLLYIIQINKGGLFMSRMQRKITYGIVLFILVALVVTMMIIFGMNPRMVEHNELGETIVVNLVR